MDILPIEETDPEIAELFKDVCNKRYDRFNTKAVVIASHAVKLVPYKTYVANRNDPCPCSSGRKFKQCHGANIWSEIFN